MGIPLGQFLNEAYAGFIAGEDHVIVGSIGPAENFYGLARTRKPVFEDPANAFSERTKYVVGPAEALNTS